MWRGAWMACCLCGSAWGQLREYKLDESGNWAQTTAPEAGTPEARLDEARRLLADDQPGEAGSILDDWIEEHERKGSPYLPQAYLLRADATAAAGNEYTALYDYETVIKEFPASEEFVKAVERELDIGVRYVNGLRRKYLGMRFVDATDIGEELLIRVQERMPGSRLAERAAIELADHYYRSREMEMAGDMYGLFLQNFRSSAYRMKAMQRRVYSQIARFKGPRYDGAPLIDARVLTREFQTQYPVEAERAGLDDALLTRLDESSAASKLEVARWYLRRGDEVAGRYGLKRLVKEHPQTGAAAGAIAEMRERGWLADAAQLERMLEPVRGGGNSAGAESPVP